MHCISYSMERMNLLSKIVFAGRGLAMILVALMFAAGCSTDSAERPATAKVSTANVLGSEILKPGDRIRIVYNDISSQVKVEPVEFQIPDDGKLILHMGLSFNFAGQHRTKMEREIERAYIDQGLYKRITISIERVGLSVSVGGEVKTAGNVMYVGGMTVVKAVNSAGGCTDFASKGRVQITRSNGTTVKVDLRSAIKDPSKDVEVYPGDQVYVPRRW